MSKFVDLVGQKYGRLTVIKRAESRRLESGRLITMWECECECGKSKIVRSDSLRNGKTNSCGCYHSEQLSQIKTKHKQAGTRLYSIWINMKVRCTNPKTPEYKNYGGRGITICEEWLQNFESFYEWSINNGYRDNLSIDRIDNNGNYEPQNCRWATMEQQANNKTVSQTYTYMGKTKTIAEWAKEKNLKYNTLFNRLKYSHWDIEKALCTPVVIKEGD